MNFIDPQDNSSANPLDEVSTLFFLDGVAVPTPRSVLSMPELRELGRDVSFTHHLRGAIRQIGGQWVIGIKCPTKRIAESIGGFLCYRWDTVFGSAITLTPMLPERGVVARSWVWAQHPVLKELRDGHPPVVVTIHRSEPVRIIHTTVRDDPRKGGVSLATDQASEDERRPGKLLIAMDEEIAYWDLFVRTHVWDRLLDVSDHLQVGWCDEFSNAIGNVATIIREKVYKVNLDPNATDFIANAIKLGDVPERYWIDILGPMILVLNGQSPSLEFVRNLSISKALIILHRITSVAETDSVLDDLRFLLSQFLDCALLSDNRTNYGKRVVFNSQVNDNGDSQDISFEQLTEHQARQYWTNIPGRGALGVSDLVSSHSVPADLSLIIDQIKAIRLGCDQKEAERAIATMADEANILNRWTIPWGARVQFCFGPFAEIDFYPYGDEISVLLKTADNAYRWSAFDLRANQWNLSYLFRNRSKIFIGEKGENRSMAEEIELAFKLVVTSIVRDFVVLEERESAFAIRRERTSRGRNDDEAGPKIIYIPRIKYFKSPNTKELETALDYESRRPHHVRAHERRADAASPYQRILAERYGFKLEPGYTFVRPHQRGGVAPDREVIYRSRSAMQSLFGIEASIESDGKSNWFRFERDVHDAMLQIGYKVDHVASAKNGDHGIDVFAENSERSEFWAIQCKCYAPKRKIGPAFVRELIGALAGYPPGTRGMLVTTSGYSSGAVELAKNSGIELRLLMPNPKNSERHILATVG